MDESKRADSRRDSDPDSILVSVTDGVLLVTINRPGQRNALSRDVLSRLSRAFDETRDNPDIRAAILRGAGDRAFAAGGDLKDLASVRDKAAVEAFSVETRRVLDGIRSFPVPVIAALNGDAIGGGAELALACDYRIAASHARVGFLQGKLAITTAWGGGIDLFRLLGTSRGLELLMSSRLVEPGEALELGLIDAVAAPEEDLDAALGRMLSAFAHIKPQVARGFKALSAAHARGASRETLEEIETENIAATWLHDDHWSAVETVMARMRSTSKDS